MTAQGELPRPTVPGYVEGIVGVAPFAQQCAECGVTWAAPQGVGDGYAIIFGGFRFHVCGGPPWRRLCRTCWRADTTGCAKRDHR